MTAIEAPGGGAAGDTGAAQSVSWRKEPQWRELLVVEDNRSDAELTRSCLKKLGVPVNMRVVETGEDALAYLRREGNYADALRPDLILLDLSLPGISGLDVLVEVKQDFALRCIPVVIFSTSEDPAEVHLCYQNHCCAYVVKPHNYPALTVALGKIMDFWFNVASPPPPPETRV